VSTTLTVVQASAAAVSALTAAYLVRVTVTRDREARAERDRDRVHEQLRRLVDALGAVRRVLRDRDAIMASDFDIARAQVAAAVALHPLPLPACDALLADDVPKPPWNVGEAEPWNRLDAALREVVDYSRSLKVSLG
jgi:hypothetical protein